MADIIHSRLVTAGVDAVVRVGARCFRLMIDGSIRQIGGDQSHYIRGGFQVFAFMGYDGMGYDALLLSDKIIT